MLTDKKRYDKFKKFYFEDKNSKPKTYFLVNKKKIST
jgi:hypothetical protein